MEILWILTRTFKKYSIPQNQTLCISIFKYHLLKKKLKYFHLDSLMENYKCNIQCTWPHDLKYKYDSSSTHTYSRNDYTSLKNVNIIK